MKKERKKLNFERAVNVFAWLSLFLAVFMALITFIASLSGKDNGKEIFGRKLLIVESDSMSKSDISLDEKIFFSTGDIIIIKVIDDASSLKDGDVITFISQSPESLGKTVTHKIRKTEYSSDGKISGFVTYGINKGKNDTSLAKPEYIIGKYSAKIEGIGNLFLFLKTPRGYYLSILIPAVLLIIFFSIAAGKLMGKQEVLKDCSDEIAELKERVSALEQRALHEPREEIEACEPDEAIEEEPLSELNEIAIEETPSDTGFIIPRGEKIAFTAKLLRLDDSIKAHFNAIHNALISFKRVKSRLSFKCISYRYGKKLIAKMTVSGKTLRLHLDLDTKSFNENAFFQKDLSNLKAYSEVPFTVKIKSPRGEANAIRLISALAEKFALSKDGKFMPIDILSQFTENAQSVKEEISPEAESFTEAPLEAADGSIFDGAYSSRKKKLSFTEKLSGLNEKLQDYFNLINSELLSYKKVKARASLRCISYRFEKNVIAKITIIGKTLKLHLALNVSDFNENVYFQKDLSDIVAYREVPFTVKIKSGRGLSNAIKLISALADKLGLYKNTNLKESQKA